MIKVPEKCLICGAGYSGGHEVPGDEMIVGLRVFFQCGASMSLRTLATGVYRILFKNCQATTNKEDSKTEG